MAESASLLDGKWEPNEYIRTMHEQRARIEKVLQAYRKQDAELEAEIERAKLFIAQLAAGNPQEAVHQAEIVPVTSPVTPQ